MRRRSVSNICLVVVLGVAAAASPLCAQSDYLAQSPHSPIATGWTTHEPADMRDAAATAPPATFDESKRLGEGRSAYDSASRDIAASSEGHAGSWMLSTVTALGAVIGLILLIRAVYAKVTGRTLAAARHDVVQVMARVPVAPRNHVLILRVAGRILVVGDSPGGMNTLAQIDDPDEVAGLLTSLAASRSHSISNSFSQHMGRFNSAYGEDAAAAVEGRDSAEHLADGARGEVSKLLSLLRSRRREVVG